MFTFPFALLILLAYCNFIHGFQLNRIFAKNRIVLRSTIENKYEAEVESENVLKISDLALKQLRASAQTGQCLRIGVKSGGCSGLSYSMDFVDSDKISESDHIEMIGDLKTAIDPKSLLYIYGLELDYSTDLIGGGFKFINPNAKRYIQIYFF